MASIKRVKRLPDGNTLYDVQYYANHVKIHRRMRAANRQAIERAVVLASGTGPCRLRWSETLTLYEDYQQQHGRPTGSLTNVRRAFAAFIRYAGDKEVERTTRDEFASFLVHYASHSPRSTPDSANHQRKELLAVTRWVRGYTGRLERLPFEYVPALPTAPSTRQPIPADKIMDYIKALPPYVRWPVLLVLLYGLRSGAVCKINAADITDGVLTAVDKGGVVRRIVVDSWLAELLDAARAWRAQHARPAAGDALFVNARGSRWSTQTLLDAAKKQWKRAGLEPRRIHEVRHTLGTEAGRRFTVGVVQAMMGHRNRRSSEVYFHPGEDMAAAARATMMADLFGNEKIVA